MKPLKDLVKGDEITLSELHTFTNKKIFIRLHDTKEYRYIYQEGVIYEFLETEDYTYMYVDKYISEQRTDLIGD